MQIIDFKIQEGLVLPALLIDSYNNRNTVSDSYYETRLIYCQNRMIKAKYLVTIENSNTLEKSLGYEVLAGYVQCPCWDSILKDTSILETE